MIRKQVETWDVPLDELDDAAKIAVKDRIALALMEIKMASDPEYPGLGVPLESAAGRQLGFSDNFLHLLDQERGYRGRMEEWRQYQSWLTNRNPARAELEAKYGYDTKHGMHLVRLMRMGREILETGKVLVKRPDAEELLSIRAGAWEYEDLVSWALGQQLALDKLYQTSEAIPMAPNRAKLSAFCQELIEQSLNPAL